MQSPAFPTTFRPNLNSVNASDGHAARPANGSGPWLVRFNGHVIAQHATCAEALQLAVAHAGCGSLDTRFGVNGAYRWTYVGPLGVVEAVR